MGSREQGKKKIVYVYYAITAFGGIERVFVDKMSCLADMGYEVYLLTANQGPHHLSFPLSDRVHFEDLNVRTHLQYEYKGFRRYWERFWRNKQLYKRLSEKIQMIQPDILVCSTNGYISELVKLKGDIPLIVESHAGFDNVIEDTDVSLRRRIERKHLLKKLYKADVIVALTESDAQKWKMRYPVVKTIPNVVHLNDSGLYSTGDNKRVIFVGRNCRQKAIPDLLKIWSMVHSKYPDWQLDMYVEREISELVKEAKALNANINVFPPVDDIMNRYLQSSILVLTSLYEPFGLVIAEAMSCGLPVVSFEGDGPSSIISDGQDGFLIKNRSNEAFASRVCQLIEDHGLRHSMGQKAITSVQRYSAEQIMPKWIELFGSI